MVLTPGRNWLTQHEFPRKKYQDEDRSQAKSNSNEKNVHRTNTIMVACSYFIVNCVRLQFISLTGLKMANICSNKQNKNLPDIDLLINEL